MIKKIKKLSVGVVLGITIALSACSSAHKKPITFDFENFDQDKTFQKAKDGNAEAQYTLGLSYLAKEELDQATEWLCKAARSKNGLAQYELARLYAGYTVDAEPEVPVALFWAEQAQKNGQAEAATIVDNLSDDLTPKQIRYLRSVRLGGYKYAPCLWNQVRSAW